MVTRPRSIEFSSSERDVATTLPLHADIIRRAALPEIMFVPDLALALQLSERSTRADVLRGKCGRYFRFDRRLVVLRRSFLEALAEREQGFGSRGMTVAPAANGTGRSSMRREANWRG